MKNPNSFWERLKKCLKLRWASEDYPGAESRFQIALFAKDIAVFILLPVLSVVIFKSCEVAITSSNKKPVLQRSVSSTDQIQGGSRSQIIDFRLSSTSRSGNVAKISPGALVKVRLLNVVETYSNAPVHVQIVDAGLGQKYFGSTIIGDAVSNTNYNRIDMTFRYVRDKQNLGVAFPISARALSLDGTLGVEARKKEGFFARSALNSTGTASQELKGGNDGPDLKNIVARALTAGLLQEFGSDSQVEKNRAQVLTLRPPIEFFVELTDFFPGTN